MARKQPIPADAIPPPIPAECGFAYCGFQELSTTRNFGFGYGPIPWTAINEFADRYGVIEIDSFDLFVHFIRVMDEAWLAHKNKTTPQ